jgi:hypothetical protein
MQELLCYKCYYTFVLFLFLFFIVIYIISFIKIRVLTMSHTRDLKLRKQASPNHDEGSVQSQSDLTRTTIPRHVKEMGLARAYTDEISP